MDDLGQSANLSAAALPAGAESGRRLTWTPRRSVQLQAALKRSRRVRVLRIVFVIASALTGLSLFGAAAFSSFANHGGPRNLLAADDTIRMLNPRFTGRTSEGKLFIVTAAEALRRNAKDSRIDLKAPVVEDGVGGSLAARKGRYDLDQHTIALSEDVRLDDIDGNQFKSKDAFVRIDDHHAESQSSVTGAGPIGDMSADAFEIIDGGKFVRLRGAVHTIIATDEERARRTAAIEQQRRARGEAAPSDEQTGPAPVNTPFPLKEKQQ